MNHRCNLVLKRFFSESKYGMNTVQEPIKNNKIFVRGLSFSTSQNSLAQYFSRFGPVVRAQISMDILSGHSRGFGFVTFENESSANMTMLPSNRHEIDGRACFAFKARGSMHMNNNNGDQNASANKI